jgi:L-malate glycosyltransferase
LDVTVKVLHCLETIGSGGVEQRRLTLARYLGREGFHQHVVCSHIINEFDKELNAYGVQVTAIGSLRHIFNLSYYWRLFHVIRKFKPHIIHGAVFEGVVSSVVGGILCRVPVIIVEETSDPQNRSWRGNFLLKMLTMFADYVVAISPSVLRYLKETAGVKDAKLTLINNGVNTPVKPLEAEVAMVRKEFGLSENDFIIGSVGRLLDSHKRFSDLIKAVHILQPEIKNVKLVIVGDGRDRHYLESMAEDLGVRDRIIFAGHQKRPGPFYECMNVFALASHMEGFGLVVVEAMFFGLPVVATAVGGIKDVVVDGTTGTLVPRHEPKALADAVFHLYRNPSLMKSFGEAGLRRAQNEYSGEVYATKVAQLYNQAIQNKPVSFK